MTKAWAITLQSCNIRTQAQPGKACSVDTNTFGPKQGRCRLKIFKISYHSGVSKRMPEPITSEPRCRALGQKRTAMCHVWTAPSWQELFSRLQPWSVQPCVRPLSAVHMTAGHNALRRSGPYHKRALNNAVAQVGCPDRRSTGSALRAVRPFQPSHHAACATGSLYRSPLVIMAQAIRAILLASAMAAIFVGRRANNAVSQGRCLVLWILA